MIEILRKYPMKRVAIFIGVMLFSLFMGCQSQHPDIVVLADTVEGQQKYVVNGGPGSTEVMYTDSEGKQWQGTSNVVRVPIAENCEKPDGPLVANLPGAQPGVGPNPDKIPSDIDFNSFHNHILVAADKTPGAFYATETVIPKDPPKIVLQKSSDEDTLCCDSELTFRIRFINEGGDDAYDINISDIVPANVEFLEESADATPYPASVELARDAEDKVRKLNWIIAGPVPPGAEGEVYYTVTCPLKRPLLSCFIRFSPQALNVGDTGQVICYVTNSGNDVAKNVKVKVNIPAGLEHEGRSLGEEIELDLGDVAAGETGSKEFPVTLRIEGTLDKMAVRASADNAEKCDCEVPPAPTLSIQKTGPEQVNNANPIENTIVVKNTSERNAPATDCILTDKLPANATFQEASDSGSYDANTHTVTWSLGTLMPGAVVMRKVVVTPQQSGDYEDLAEVTCSEGITVNDKAVTIVKGYTAMHINKYDTEDPVAVGDTTTYVIEVRNEGFKDATGIVLKNEIPELTTFMQAKGTGPNGEVLEAKVEGQMVTFDALELLASGAKVVYNVTVRVKASGQLLNRSSLQYNEFGKILVVEEPTTSYE